MLKIMQHVHPNLQFMHMLPYGAVLHDHGVQFVVFSRNATEMRLLLYDDVNDREPSEIISFDPRSDRWGDIWSIFVPELGAGQLYHFQASGPSDPARGMRFQPQARLVDPYARALAGEFQSSEDGIVRPPRCVVVDDYFDWQGDRHLNRDFSETVIYEMHVAGFTRHPSSGVEFPGTYRGVIEKIPYLQSLGITAVELMPVAEFRINDVDGQTAKRKNYWGYDSLAFFAPHRGYAADRSPGGQVAEFKEMVKQLHHAGIEVILDVVFNHTCEGNHLGPVLSMKGLENSVYYMLEDDARHYRNYSGCGNTVNGNHPIVREMIFHCLRHWVHNYHIDGFRFDLASILSRDRRGNLVANPPLVEAIAEDPLLADTKIIAEAWDAAGAYQVGTFGDGRWAEWNGRYRDDVRRYWRGDSGMRGAFATRISGSADLYQPAGRPPHCSINFVTSHDGFTLNDLVSYRDKHNLQNQEDNLDGDNNNHSMNFGVEGPTADPLVDRKRLQVIKNYLATLMISQGVPMLVAGDECRRTQKGNNNAWCQDNEISWFDWDLAGRNSELLRFARCLVHFRRQQPVVRRRWFLTGQRIEDRTFPDVTWFDCSGKVADWEGRQLPLACLLGGSDEGNQDLFLLFNPLPLPCAFEIPDMLFCKSWNLFVDTGAEAPADVFPEYDGPMLQGKVLLLGGLTTAIYVSHPS
jgi:glycogen operon protein